MRRLPLHCLLIGFCVSRVLAQTNTTQISGVYPLEQVFEVLKTDSRYSRTMLDAQIAGVSRVKQKTSEQAVADLDSWLNLEKRVVKDIDKSTEYNLLMKHKDAIGKLLGNFAVVGTHLGKFIYSEVPVKFAMKDDLQVCLVTSLVGSDVYNTLSTTPKARVAKVVTSVVLPAFRKFQESFPENEVKSFGILVVYGTKDFSDKGGLTFKSEAVGVVVSSDACKRFVKGEIAEEDLLDIASIYLADRDMPEGMKRIRVSLE